jgi:hypothetical protein
MTTCALNVFVVDDHDQPVPDALVKVFVDGQLREQGQTASAVAGGQASPGAASAHMDMEVPEQSDVRVTVTHQDQTLEQRVDLDAPNVTFRMSRDRPPATDAGPRPRRRTRSVETESITGSFPLPAISLTRLREAFVREFNRADLDLLSQDIDAQLRLAQPSGRFSLEDLPSGGLEYQIGELLKYFDRRQTLALLIESAERARPGFRTRAGLPPPGPAPVTRPAGGRPVIVTAKIRLAEVPTSIYDMLQREGWPLVSVELMNQRDVAFSGSLTVELQRFSDQSIQNVDLDPGGSSSVPLHPVLNRNQIDELREMERVTLLVGLQSIDNQTVSRQTENLYLLPRSAAPLAVKDLMTGEWRDLRPYLGGYVTPQAEMVQGFLSEVSQRVPDRRLLGYGGPPAAVEPQVRAAYEALAAHGVSYAHSALVFHRHQSWASQRLRLPSQTLQKKVANCLDGAVLVFTGTDDSAHAFVAWETAEVGGTWRYLETNGFVTATFDEARKEAEGKAAAFEAEQKASGAGIFARLAIRDLREQNINPLE